MIDFSILTYLIFLPLVGAFLIYLGNKFFKNIDRTIYIIVSGLEFLLGAQDF